MIEYSSVHSTATFSPSSRADVVATCAVKFAHNLPTKSSLVGIRRVRRSNGDGGQAETLPCTVLHLEYALGWQRRAHDLHACRHGARSASVLTHANSEFSNQRQSTVRQLDEREDESRAERKAPIGS